MPTWHVVLCFIIGTFGILGNSLTLTVLFKRKRWTSVNVLIGIMSVSDLFVIPFVASATLQSYIVQRLYTYEATTYLRHTFMTSSYVCVMIIGCERSFAVRSPLKLRETWNTKCVAYFLIVRGVPFVVILVTNILVIRVLLKKQQISYGDDVTEPRQRKDKDRNSHYQNSCGRYKCIIYMHGTKSLSYNTQSNACWTFCWQKIDNYLTYNCSGIVKCSVNSIIYTVTSKQYRQEYSKLLSSCFCCFNTCCISTKANDTCRRSTKANHTCRIWTRANRTCRI